MTETRSASSRRKFSLPAWLLASLLVPLLLFAAAAWYDRAVILQTANERLSSTTDALAGQAEAVMQTADLALSLELDAVKGMDWQTIGNSAEVYRFLVSLHDKLPELDSAFFVDPNGFNSASSRAFPMRSYDDRDREYYQDAQREPTRIILSTPFVGRAQGGLGFVVSRARVTDGRFDGVAAVTLQPSFFRRLYGSVMRGPESSAAMLVRGDGTLLASYPAPTDGVLRLPPASVTMQAAASGRNALFEGRSVRDGRYKIASVHWLPGRDAFVVASIDHAQLLTTWYLHLALFAGFALVAALALAVTAAMALRRADDERRNLEVLVAETNRRQQAEAALQQAQKMDALGRLTGGVAHDFNNLLTAVLGSLELALRRVSDPTVVRLLNAATTAAQRGAKLTAQMLAFARKKTLALQTIDGNEVVTGMDELLRRSIGPLVRLTYQLEPAPWPVLVDRVQLELAILNLVVNSHDAMPEGGELTIATRNVAAGTATSGASGDHVVMTIIDSGQGMTPDVRASAFEPFFTTKGPGKGTGLGLSMVYGFAQQAGGTVTLNSVLGSGTSVSIHLPRAADTVPVPAPLPGEPTAEQALSELLVLLVDDDATAREPTAAMLRELGCIVTDVDRGSAALDLLRGGMPCDLLLLDFAMPEMNGAQLATAAKELRAQLPIVFITGYADAALLDRLQEMGIQVVTKPFRMDTLAAALRRATARPIQELAK